MTTWSKIIEVIKRSWHVKIFVPITHLKKIYLMNSKLFNPCFVQSAGLGCRNNANCPQVGLRPMGDAFHEGSFYGILARIYASFGENHWRIGTTTSTSVIWGWTRHLSSTSLQSRTTQPLAGRIITRTLASHEMPWLLKYVKYPYFQHRSLQNRQWLLDA